MPKSLYPKKDSKRPSIPPMLWFWIAFIVIFILAIALAIACTSPYNMTWA